MLQNCLHVNFRKYVQGLCKGHHIIAVNESYDGCVISVDGQSYREGKSGMNMHMRDNLGHRTQLTTNDEQLDIMTEYNASIDVSNRCLYER